MKINRTAKYKKIKLQNWYNLNGEYIRMLDAELDGTVYENASVKFSKSKKTICGTDFIWNVVHIEGQEPIECELLSQRMQEDMLIINICQDWG